MAMIGIKIEQSTICGLMATDQSFYTGCVSYTFITVSYIGLNTETTIPIRRTKALEPGGVLPIGGGSSRKGYLFQASGI